MITDPKKPKLAASMLRAFKELKALSGIRDVDEKVSFDTLIGSFSVEKDAAENWNCSLLATSGERLSWSCPTSRDADLSVRSLYLSIVKQKSSSVDSGVVKIQDREGTDIYAFRYQIVRMLMVHSLAERIAAIERREEEPELIKCMSMSCAELGECWKEHGQAVWQNVDHGAYRHSFVEPIILTRSPAPSPAP